MSLIRLARWLAHRCKAIPEALQPLGGVAAGDLVPWQHWGGHGNLDLEKHVLGVDAWHFHIQT